ncbi:uncharacterized protein LOC111863977 isoform X2 [Cryptotermes secundus]|uniref:uncharacterized protein LOC111863977 isoform X2 n=1 Tax=Cryptotermes secundus TaxID=105785 RepID=UPI000CD7D2BD|nr:uncharacterized protein LOC111863977 isoform X2 [Cryptotermes secundus]
MGDCLLPGYLDKDGIINLESDSDSDMQDPCVESQMISVKEEPPDMSSCESSDSDFKEEDESDMCEMEGKSISDSDVKEHCDGNRLIHVKEEPPNATSSASSADEVVQKRFTYDTVKQEIPDDAYVSGVQSDLGATQQCHRDTLQLPVTTSSSPIFESRAEQVQVLFTSVKVKCEVKDEIEAKEGPR